MVSPNVSVHGCEFVIGSVILVSCDEDELPLFARVTNIYVKEQAIYLIYQSFATDLYCPKLNAYLVNLKRVQAPSIMDIRHLIHPHPLSLFLHQRRKYIVLFNHVRTESLL